MKFKNKFILIKTLKVKKKKKLRHYPKKLKNKAGNKKINFNYSTTINYELVQKQLSGFIQLHLKEVNYQISHREYKNECLNFTWFIRDKADVFMSHGVADKNYVRTKNKLTGTYFINNFKIVLVS